MGNMLKPSARDAFDLNMADAEMLVELGKLLRNRRSRRMRVERRERIGHALGIGQRRWKDLECLENEAIFMTLKPGHGNWRTRLDEAGLRPLLRQALVAACAAVETFCADRVMERYGAAIKAPSPCLLELRMTLGDYSYITDNFKRPGWGLRQIVELEVRKRASPAPSQIGELFGLIGEKDLMGRVDTLRKVEKGSSTETLERIVTRRNLIAHTGDRKGRGRAAITIPEVEADISYIISIVDALDAVTRPSVA